MTTASRLNPQMHNMIAAWAGALTTLTLLVTHAWAPGYRYVQLISSVLLAAILIGLIVRFKPNQPTTMALCAAIGAAFTTFSFCLTLCL